MNPAFDGLAGEDVQVIVKIGAIAIARTLGASIANTDALTTIAQFVEAAIAENIGRKKEN